MYSWNNIKNNKIIVINTKNMLSSVKYLLK